MRGWNTGLAAGPVLARALDAVKALGASARQIAQTNGKSNTFTRAISLPSFFLPSAFT